MPSEYLELSVLSERTGIPLRKLRYVVDHQLAPERSWSVIPDEIGHPRSFDTVSATFLVCSAFLLEAGCKRETVRQVMLSILTQVTGRRSDAASSPLVQKAMKSQPALLQIGDGEQLRWMIGTTYDSGWLDPKLRHVPDFNPKVTIQVNFALIRDLVMGKSMTD